MKLDYVGGAYLVFVLVLGWDYVAPRVKLARVRRAIALRLRRNEARSAA
jgi:heme exporter protein D